MSQVRRGHARGSAAATSSMGSAHHQCIPLWSSPTPHPSGVHCWVARPARLGRGRTHSQPAETLARQAAGMRPQCDISAATSSGPHRTVGSPSLPLPSGPGGRAAAEAPPAAPPASAAPLGALPVLPAARTAQLQSGAEFPVLGFPEAAAASGCCCEAASPAAAWMSRTASSSRIIRSWSTSQSACPAGQKARELGDRKRLISWGYSAPETDCRCERLRKRRELQAENYRIIRRRHSHELHVHVDPSEAALQRLPDQCASWRSHVPPGHSAAAASSHLAASLRGRGTRPAFGSVASQPSAWRVTATRLPPAGGTSRCAARSGLSPDGTVQASPSHSEGSHPPGGAPHLCGQAGQQRQQLLGAPG